MDAIFLFIHQLFLNNIWIFESFLSRPDLVDNFDNNVNERGGTIMCRHTIPSPLSDSMFLKFKTPDLEMGAFQLWNVKINSRQFKLELFKKNGLMLWFWIWPQLKLKPSNEHLAYDRLFHFKLNDFLNKYLSYDDLN